LDQVVEICQGETCLNELGLKSKGETGLDQSIYGRKKISRFESNVENDSSGCGEFDNVSESELHGCLKLIFM